MKPNINKVLLAWGQEDYFTSARAVIPRDVIVPVLKNLGALNELEMRSADVSIWTGGITDEKNSTITLAFAATPQSEKSDKESERKLAKKASEEIEKLLQEHGSAASEATPPASLQKIKDLAGQLRGMRDDAEKSLTEAFKAFIDIAKAGSPELIEAAKKIKESATKIIAMKAKIEEMGGVE